MRNLLPILLGVALLSAGVLAGCAGPAAKKDKGQDQVLTTRDVETKADKGAISGVVVSETITPLAHANVTLGNGVASTTTDEKGDFVFSDLEPGTYFLVTDAGGFQSINTAVEVVAGEVAHPRILLTHLPISLAYHYTLQFQGFIQFSGAASGSILNIILDGEGQDNPTCRCSFTYNTAGQNVSTMVVEAVWKDSGSDPRGPTDLYLEVYPDDLDDGTADIQGGFLTSPIHEPYPIAAWGEGENNTNWHVRLTGSADHVNVNQAYDLFVTVFVDGEAPKDWSVANGDQ